MSNGHGDVTAVSTGPPPVMDLGIKRPGLLGGPVERTTHRPRFGASPSLLCSSVTRKRPKCFEAGFFSGSLTCTCVARRCAGYVSVGTSNAHEHGSPTAALGPATGAMPLPVHRAAAPPRLMSPVSALPPLPLVPLTPAPVWLSVCSQRRQHPRRTAQTHSS